MAGNKLKMAGKLAATFQERWGFRPVLWVTTTGWYVLALGPNRNIPLGRSRARTEASITMLEESEVAQAQTYAQIVRVSGETTPTAEPGQSFVIELDRQWVGFLVSVLDYGRTGLLPEQPHDLYLQALTEIGERYQVLLKTLPPTAALNQAQAEFLLRWSQARHEP